ncbi:MAG: M14 family metallopeptidase [Alphaproteobacteria bacterium]
MTFRIELEAPDISAYAKGNTGIPYVTTFDSGAPGPHVMVNAVTHGNEICGAITLDRLFRQDLRPIRGRLTLGFANVDAYLRFNPARPTASRYVNEDFNRLWSPEVLDGPRHSSELSRARIYRPFIDTVDFLLDLHSMQQPSPPLMLAGPLEKGRLLAAGVGVPTYVVADSGHAAGRRLRDYGNFGDPTSPRSALLVECGQHWEAASAAVSLETTLRFLRYLEVIDPQFAEEHGVSVTPPAQKFIEVTDAVTAKSNDFRFVRPYTGAEVIAQAGSVIAYDGETAIRTPYDQCVLIMPSLRLYPGQTAVRLGRLVSAPN